MKKIERPTPHSSIRNAEPFGKRNSASVFTKEKINRIGFPCAEGNGFRFCFVFKWSPEASAITLGTLPLTLYANLKPFNKESSRNRKLHTQQTPFLAVFFRYCVVKAHWCLSQGHFGSRVSARICDLTNQFFKINGFLKICAYIFKAFISLLYMTSYTDGISVLPFFLDQNVN